MAGSFTDGMEVEVLKMITGQATSIITTTPKPLELITDLNEGKVGGDVYVSRASSYDNKSNLSPTFFKQLESYEGTDLGRQEIYGEILDPDPDGEREGVVGVNRRILDGDGFGVGDGADGGGADGGHRDGRGAPRERERIGDGLAEHWQAPLRIGAREVPVERSMFAFVRIQQQDPVPGGQVDRGRGFGDLGAGAVHGLNGGGQFIL